jgi:hypothetical protein
MTYRRARSGIFYDREVDVWLGGKVFALAPSEDPLPPGTLVEVRHISGSGLRASLVYADETEEARANPDRPIEAIDPGHRHLFFAHRAAEALALVPDGDMPSRAVIRVIDVPSTPGAFFTRDIPATEVVRASTPPTPGAPVRVSVRFPVAQDLHQLAATLTLKRDGEEVEVTTALRGQLHPSVPIEDLIAAKTYQVFTTTDDDGTAVTVLISDEADPPVAIAALTARGVIWPAEE